MNYFNKLKGFQRSPDGLERQIWKLLHIILTTGTVLTLTIGYAIVMLMKGTFYIANAYHMEGPPHVR